MASMCSGQRRKHMRLQDFRLWLTTEPTASLPRGLLQRSLKVGPMCISI